MDFGIFADFHTRIGMPLVNAFDDSFREVDAAEELGIGSVWLSEDHFTNLSMVASPLVVASAVAARTSKIRIGLAVLVLPLYNPLQIAEEAATVDQISKGRLDFGIGRSGVVKYYHGYNMDYEESRGRFSEAMDVILRAWSDDPLSYQGEYYTFSEVNVMPKPYQKPHPPMRVAVNSDDTFAAMGSLGYPIFISITTPRPRLERGLQLYRQARQEAGYTYPDDVILRLPVYVAETADRARSEPEASTMQQIRASVKEFIDASNEETTERLQRIANAPYEEVLEQRASYGTPEAVVDRLQGYQEELGISGVVMEMNYGGQIPHDRVVNSMRLFTEKVIPKLN